MRILAVVSYKLLACLLTGTRQGLTRNSEKPFGGISTASLTSTHSTPVPCRGFLCLAPISLLTCSIVACRSVRVCVFTPHRFAPEQHVYLLLATAIHSSVQSHQSSITVMLIFTVTAGVLFQAPWERRGHHPPSRHHQQSSFVLRCPRWPMPRMQWKMLPQ